MKLYKYILFICITCSVFLLSNCNKDTDDCDPDAYCDTLPYDSGYVNIQSSYKGQGIPIIVYNGYVEDNDVLFYDTMWDVEYSYWLPLDKRYSVEAYYYESNKTIIALDGAKIKQASFWNCGEECYEESEITLDVKKL